MLTLGGQPAATHPVVALETGQTVWASLWLVENEYVRRALSEQFFLGEWVDEPFSTIIFMGAPKGRWFFSKKSTETKKEKVPCYLVLFRGSFRWPQPLIQILHQIQN